MEAGRGRWWARAGRGGLDLLFPLTCEGCGVEVAGGVLCAACGRDRWVVEVQAARCTVCGRPWEGESLAGLDLPGPSLVCGRCRADHPPFQSHRSGLVHGGPVRELIAALKYRRRRDLAPRLAAWAWGGWPGCDGDLLVPVPLAAARLRVRGFNQALLLARWAGRRWGVEVETRGVVRRPGPPQVGLTRAQRRINARGRFPVVEGSRFRGRRVVVVDDVFTTGSTVAALARALTGAGATEVRVITLAYRS